MFSGTRISFEGLEAEVGSIMAKETKEQPPKPHFFDFELLKSGDVREHLLNFLQTDGVRPCVLNHVCEWLCGRPRWTATFLEK